MNAYFLHRLISTNIIKMEIVIDATNSMLYYLNIYVRRGPRDYIAFNTIFTLKQAFW